MTVFSTGDGNNFIQWKNKTGAEGAPKIHNSLNGLGCSLIFPRIYSFYEIDVVCERMA